MIKLFNTLTKKKQLFKPLKGKTVRMYACGPTVYKPVHIGNLRTYLFEDILRRTLEYNGYKVKYVMNITDFGHLISDADTGADKVEHEAKKRGKTVKEITKFYADEFKRNLQKLNIKMPNKFAWASKYIKEQIDLIKRLEKRGYTYMTNDGVYFDTDKFKNYGRLNKTGVSGFRVIDIDKKEPTDFALWRLSKKGEKREYEWSSPWGVGYPGWHIECSAISAKELGQPFDIHAGGEDLIAIHHNNEIAQSEAAYNKPLAKFWIHGAFVLAGKDKMSKSRGNFVTLDGLGNQGFDPMVFRYLVISSHYRQKLNFSRMAMVSAQTSLSKLRVIFGNKKRGGKVLPKYKKEFLSAINNDLGLPNAMRIVWRLVKSKTSLADKQATLLDFDKVLGLRLKDYKLTIPANVKKLVAKREVVRKKKDFKLADRLRKQILVKGFVVDDTVGGPIVNPK